MEPPIESRFDNSLKGRSDTDLSGILSHTLRSFSPLLTLNGSTGVRTPHLIGISRGSVPPVGGDRSHENRNVSDQRLSTEVTWRVLGGTPFLAVDPCVVVETVSDHVSVEDRIEGDHRTKERVNDNHGGSGTSRSHRWENHRTGHSPPVNTRLNRVRARRACLRACVCVYVRDDVNLFGTDGLTSSPLLRPPVERTGSKSPLAQRLSLRGVRSSPNSWTELLYCLSKPSPQRLFKSHSYQFKVSNIS